MLFENLIRQHEIHTLLAYGRVVAGISQVDVRDRSADARERPISEVLEIDGYQLRLE
jgi:hypothetical protein